MLSKVAIGLLVLAAAPAALIAGGSVREKPFVDRKPPALSWWVEKEGERGAEGFHSAAGRMKADSGITYIISAEGRDNAALGRLSLSGVGTFRCASRDGAWTAPYDILLPLQNLLETQQVTVGQQIRTQGRIQRRLRVTEISCGSHRVPGQSTPQELFAVSGEILLRAVAADMTGGSVQGTLHIAATAASRQPGVPTAGSDGARGHLVAWR